MKVFEGHFGDAHVSVASWLNPSFCDWVSVPTWSGSGHPSLVLPRQTVLWSAEMF